MLILWTNEITIFSDRRLQFLFCAFITCKYVKFLEVARIANHDSRLVEAMVALYAYVIDQLI